MKLTKKIYKYVDCLVYSCKWCDGTGYNTYLNRKCLTCKGTGGKWKRTKKLVGEEVIS